MPAITKRAKEIARLERAADEGRVKVEAIIWIDRAVGARAERCSTHPGSIKALALRLRS